LASQAADEIDDRAPDFRIRDFHESLVQFDALAAAQEIDDIPVRRAFGEAAGRGRLRLVTRGCAGCVLVEELDAHAEHPGKLEEAARTDAIDPLLVLLNLLEGETE